MYRQISHSPRFAILHFYIECSKSIALFWETLPTPSPYPQPTLLVPTFHSLIKTSPRDVHNPSWSWGIILIFFIPTNCDDFRFASDTDDIQWSIQDGRKEGRHVEKTHLTQFHLRTSAQGSFISDLGFSEPFTKSALCPHAERQELTNAADTFQLVTFPINTNNMPWARTTAISPSTF